MSNVIKSSHYVSLDKSKVIKTTAFKMPKLEQVQERSRAANGLASTHQAADLEQAVRDRQLEAEIEKIKAEAREEADAIIRQAEEQAEQMLREREQELAEWQATREQEIELELQQVVETAREQAYAEGLAKGEQEARAEWEQALEQAASILEDAHIRKRQIVSEAEPFLLELSVQIAETIIGRQLSLEQDWVIDLIKRVLAKERQRGVVTLCVSPGQYGMIRDSRDELAMTIDSQAELQIVPDASVSEHGCVIRTDFGSLDARIDSQLSEIKQALLQMYASEHEEVVE